MWNGNLKTAINSLRMSKWRSLLTMLGIIIGVSSVVTVVSLGEGLKQQVVGQIGQLGKDVITVRSGRLVGRNAKGDIDGFNLLAFLSSSTLTERDVAALQKLPSINPVVPLDFVTSSAKSDNGQSDNLYVIGTSPEMSNVLNQKVRYGQFFQSDDPDQTFAVIGSGVARALFGDSNPTGQSVTIMGENFIVRGVLAPSSGGLFSVAETDFNSAIFIPFSPAKDLTGSRTNILQILLKNKPGHNLNTTVNDIRRTLLKSHDGQENFTVLKQYELLNIASGVVNTFTSFISGIAAISLLVGGIGIMDIMLVSVSERTREIGVRKAIGATNRQILNQFLVEGLALSIGGGAIGIVASLIIYTGLKLYTNLNPVITVPVVILAVGVSVAVGIIFSVAPALKAASKNPIDALRGE
jgi:putative ABC transport system permease protein